MPPRAPHRLGKQALGSFFPERAKNRSFFARAYMDGLVALPERVSQTERGDLLNQS